MATACWCALPASSRTGAPKARSSRCCRRAHPTVVGEFRVGRRGSYVVPQDGRIQQWIEIPEGMEIPQPAARWTASARRPIEIVGPVRSGRHDRQRRDARISRRRRARGGTRDRDPGPSRRFRHRRGDRHPQASSAASFSARGGGAGRSGAARDRRAGTGGRRDFRDLRIVTIDGETARDFDDAVWVDGCPTATMRCRCTSPT